MHPHFSEKNEILKKIIIHSLVSTVKIHLVTLISKKDKKYARHQDGHKNLFL